MGLPRKMMLLSHFPAVLMIRDPCLKSVFPTGLYKCTSDILIKITRRQSQLYQAPRRNHFIPLGVSNSTISSAFISTENLLLLLDKLEFAWIRNKWSLYGLVSAVAEHGMFNVGNRKTYWVIATISWDGRTKENIFILYLPISSFLILCCLEGFS